MWRTTLAYLYIALLASSLWPLGLHNDAKAPLFWSVVLARIQPGSLPPAILCDLRDRAQLPRDDKTCGGAPSASGRQAPPPGHPAP